MSAAHSLAHFTKTTEQGNDGKRFIAGDDKIFGTRLVYSSLADKH